MLLNLQKLRVVFHNVQQNPIYVGPQLFVDLLLFHERFLELQKRIDKSKKGENSLVPVENALIAGNRPNAGHVLQ